MLLEIEVFTINLNSTYSLNFYCKRRRKEVKDFMRLRRDVLIAVLATFCLTSALFAVKPSGSLSSKQYDPWMDINDDGRIDMRDIGQLCINFGAAGDPTKPVIINHNWREGNCSFSLNPGGYTSFNIFTTGFRTVTIRILAYSIDTHKFQLSIMPKVTGSICNRLDYVISSHTPFVILIVPPYPWYNVMPANFEKTYEVAFSELMIGIYNNSTTNTLYGTLYYYLNT
jgi:hypothetical protein